MTSNLGPDHINPVQWHHSLGYARQVCARIFRDGGTPRDAIKALGLTAPSDADWSKAVELIAEVLCTRPLRKAA
jgi:hypothetical protein